MLRRPHGFVAWLAGIAAGALAIRLVYALLLAPEPPALSDAGFFHLLANFLADGRGFVRPYDLVFFDSATPTAEHPPAWSVLLAAMSALGGQSHDAHRVVGCLCGTGTVAAIGVLGRRVAGERAGLIAAGIAAAYPMLWVVDGTLMSESLYGLTIALALLAAYAVVERPSAARAAALGAAMALAALTRGEGMALVVLLGVPVALLARAGARGRLVTLAVIAAAFAAVLAPWLVRNWSAFDRPVLVSNNTGTLLAGANCGGVYAGSDIGSWTFLCIDGPRRRNEAVQAAELRRRGLDYAREHAGRLPVVLPVRVLRTWDAYRPLQGARFMRTEGRRRFAQYLGLAAYYPLLVLAVFGFVVLRRRGATPWLLLVPAVLVTLTSLGGFGLPRFRMAAEISIVVLAAAALDAFAARRREARG
ncbi:MAG TPA: glycosyltransferase family 39 protein [Solirubrobacteraceae bacterium]|nr:glycosyltransferase family 39 protein [Solirubrobacteraceae bacterium]